MGCCLCHKYTFGVSQSRLPNAFFRAAHSCPSLCLFISMRNLAKMCYLRRTAYSWKVESARGVKKT